MTIRCGTDGAGTYVYAYMCVYQCIVCKSIIVYLICDCKCDSWCHQCRMHASNRVCCSVLWYVVLCHALCWCCVLWCVVLCYVMHGGCVELCCAVLWCVFVCVVMWCRVVWCCGVSCNGAPEAIDGTERYQISVSLVWSRQFLSSSLFKLYIYF